MVVQYHTSPGILPEFIGTAGTGSINEGGKGFTIYGTNSPNIDFPEGIWKVENSFLFVKPAIGEFIEIGKIIN